MLTVLAGGLSAKVTTATEPKVAFATCMAIFYAATGSLTSHEIALCGWGSIPGGIAIENFLSRLTGKRSFAVWLGERILRALRIARVGSLGAGLVGFAIIAT